MRALVVLGNQNDLHSQLYLLYIIVHVLVIGIFRHFQPVICDQIFENGS